MTSTQGKRGRKAKDHKCTWDGQTINGLYRKPGTNVWRVRATGQEFTEPDERLAVARFLKAQERTRSDLGAITAHPDAHDAMVDVLRRTIAAGGSLATTVRPTAGSGWVVADETLSPQQWAWLRKKFMTEPKWVAQMVGIEELGWYSDWKKPTASPTLEEIGDLYADKPGLSDNEASRSRLFWKEFSKAIGVKTVREITHDLVARYEAKIQDADYAPKSVLHRYRKIRTILAYAIKRGKSPEDCRKALDVTAMLEVKEHTPLDPKPITVGDFWDVYDAATEAGDRTYAALLLTALNCCMYGGEVAALRWDEIDENLGQVVTRRPKTGVSRVAVLWPETLKALKGVPRRGEHVFNTRVRSYTIWSVLDGWRKYRTAAGLGDDVVFSMIRDAAFTVACQNGTLDQARMLAGHKLPGVSDHYLRRNPRLVADACKAIRAAFYPRTAT